MATMNDWNEYQSEDFLNKLEQTHQAQTWLDQNEDFLNKFEKIMPDANDKTLDLGSVVSFIRDYLESHKSTLEPSLYAHLGEIDYTALAWLYVFDYMEAQL
jgi:hypothetical protein